jgi:hypothetical protein
VAVLVAGARAEAQTTSDLMPAPPPLAPGQIPYTLPGAPAPTIASPVERNPLTRSGGASGTAPGRTGYDIYEPTSMFAVDERGPSHVEGGNGGPVPETHVVRKGDTLWDISSFYFHNAWAWPKLWALNPSITNPHWIYPGDIVRLLAAADEIPTAPAPPSAIAPERPRRPIRAEGILLRQTGFIEPDELKSAGKIIASKEEKIMLGALDEAYVQLTKDRPLKVGERYTVYRLLEEVKHPVSHKKLGKLVQILGEAEVKSLTDGDIARIKILDSTDPIERGYFVGPLRRQFKVVEPVRNPRELEGVIVVGLRPLKLLGSQNLVFIDKGKVDGVGLGNRFFVTRRGDGYQPILAQGPIDDKRFPREIVAEILIIDTRQSLAAGLVIRSARETRVGDRVEARKGY